MQRAYRIRLTSEQEDDLLRFARSRTLAARLVERAKMLVLYSAGHTAGEIADQLGVSRPTVPRWLGRFEEKGIQGLEDAPRSGRPPVIPDSKIAEIVAKTTRETPAGATHWSTRTLAPVAGVSPSSVGRIWRAHGLKPHRVSRFKLSNDPRFAEKLEDVVGLYLHPPANAMVLSLDEVPDPGLGAYATRPALEKGPLRDDDARLQAPRDDHAVHGHEYAGWDGDRRMHAHPYS